MNIEVFGSDDPRTEKLIENLKVALGKTRTFVKIKKITDPRNLSKYGPVMLPALAINGNIISRGRVPRPEELAKNILRERR